MHGAADRWGGADWAGRPVVVAGAAVAGAAAARALLRRGATVTVLDRRATTATEQLADAGATVVVGDRLPDGVLERASDLVVSPGFPPDHPLVREAAAAGVPVYSEPELAWRLRGPDCAPWLAVTGTNGKTTTVTMLAAILTAAGWRTAAVGNIGTPLVDLPGHTDPDGYDVLAVELSSQQLHWSTTLAPPAAALLNLADDHLEWHGGFAAYQESKQAVWRAAGAGSAAVAVGNADDPRVAALLAAVPGRRIGFTLAEPGPGQLGIVDGTLVDHAFADSPIPLLAADRIQLPGRHQLANALAAAALARAHGAPPEAVAAGLAGYRPEPHRNALVDTVDGVGFVDDSKATNPHAALASLRAYPRVVWIAGGQLKGVRVDELVQQVADRLVGAVLLGVDRQQVAEQLARYAPAVPVVSVDRTDAGAMQQVVQAAAEMARPGDTVLLAPAAASRDMFFDYAHRGEAFAAAVAEHARQRGGAG